MSSPAPTSFYQNTIITGFQAVYLGPFATAPTTDNNGNPLVVGQLYFNTATNNLWVWNGSAWQLSTAGSIANPSGSIGLTPINGSTGFTMDAGSAPAINQGIAPTWTSAHTWSSTVTFNGVVTANAAATFKSAGPQVTLGANGGNGGSLTLSGATSGSSTISVTSTGQLTISSPGNDTVAFSNTGGNNGGIQLNGGTSGMAQLFATATGNGLNIIASGGTTVSGPLATNNSSGFQTIAGTGTVTSGLVIVSTAAGGTLTLPASPLKGQELRIKAGIVTTGAYISASSNVVPLQSTTAGTALLAIGGKFVHLIHDGTNWQIVAQG